MPILFEDAETLITTATPFLDSYMTYVHQEVNVGGVLLFVGKEQSFPPGKRHIELDAKLFLSPPQAKQLALLLGRFVEVYERVYGAIPTSLASEDALKEEIVP